MNTLMPPLWILGVAALSLSGLGNYGLAQNQPFTQPATGPAPMTVSPTNGNPTIQQVNPNIQQVNPPRVQQGPINQPPTGTPGSSPNAATTSQMQTPLGGGTPQTAGSVPPGTAVPPVNQQNISQSGQRAASPPISPGTFFQPAFVPTYVPPAIPFDPTNPVLTIGNLDPSGVYYQSGLRPGDVVLSTYGVPIQTEAEFRQLALQYPGQPMPLVVRRDGQEQRFEVLAQQSPARLGVRFDTGISNAALVTSVTPGSPAEAAMLRPGDIITALNGQRISSYQQAMQILGAMQPGDPVDIRFTRRVGNETRATLDRRPYATARPTAYPPSVRTDRADVPAASNGQSLPQ